MKISLIIATYNRPDALNVVLQSLETQTDNDFEIIIADDGSNNETKDLILEYVKKSKNAIKHIWHEDLGFRLSKIRNLATKSATGDYLIYLDGDCVTQPDFIKQHRKLSEKGFMVTGSRILLSEKFTKKICQEKQWDFNNIRSSSFKSFLKNELNKFLPLFIKLPDAVTRKYRGFQWRRIKGCNLGCWKKDAELINGFDESLTGWGHEDADFVFRMYKAGINRKSGAWATEVIHLWHKMASKESAEKNAAIVRAKILAKSN